MGRLRRAIAEGQIPGWSNGPEPERIPAPARVQAFGRGIRRRVAPMLRDPRRLEIAPA